MDKIKIELNYTKKELTTLINGLNNAILVLNQEYKAAWFGCSYSEKLHPLLENKDFDEIKNIWDTRINALMFLYNKLIKLEQSD